MRGEQIGPQRYELMVLGGAFGKTKKEGRAKARPYKKNRFDARNMSDLLETLLCGLGFDAVEGHG